MTVKDMAAFSCIYTGFSKITAKRNTHEQYTYTQSPNIANTGAKVYLWCGSKEPYALKSHRIIKQYLKNYEEEIFDGYAHGEMFFFEPEKLCEKLIWIGHEMQRERVR